MVTNSIKFIFAWVITTFIWLTVWIPFYILGFLVTWVGILFCNRNSEKLPLLWWPWDNSHGINGTIGYNNLNWVIICNPDILLYPANKQLSQIKYIVDSKTGNERTYKNRWVWITWRNPVSNLSLYPMGKKITNEVVTTQTTIGSFIFEKTTSGFLWFYSITIKYSDKRGFFYGFGWKFTDPADNRARFIYRISPYRALQ